MASVATAGAGLVTDEHAVGAERVPVGAALRRQDHPAALGAGDEGSEAGHAVSVAPVRAGAAVTRSRVGHNPIR